MPYVRLALAFGVFLLASKWSNYLLVMKVNSTHLEYVSGYKKSTMYLYFAAKFTTWSVLEKNERQLDIATRFSRHKNKVSMYIYSCQAPHKQSVSMYVFL